VNQPSGDEFYVGYLDPAPAALGGWLRRMAAFSLILAVALAAAVGMGQRLLPEASFEYGVTRDFEGWLVHDPYPSLLVPAGAVTNRHLLVAPGKSGADALTGGGSERWVRLEATRIIRGNQTLFMRRDEVEAAWNWIDPILSAWQQSGSPSAYTAGTWGPSSSIALIERDGRTWYEDAV